MPADALKVGWPHCVQFLYWAAPQPGQWRLPAGSCHAAGLALAARNAAAA